MVALIVLPVIFSGSPLLLAPQSDARRIGIFRNFHPNPIHKLIAFEHLSLYIQYIVYCICIYSILYIQYIFHLFKQVVCACCSAYCLSATNCGLLVPRSHALHSTAVSARGGKAKGPQMMLLLQCFYTITFTKTEKVMGKLKKDFFIYIWQNVCLCSVIASSRGFP